MLDLLGMGSSEEDQHQTTPYSFSTPPPAPVVLPDLMDGWDASEDADVPQVISHNNPGRIKFQDCLQYFPSLQ